MLFWKKSTCPPVNKSQQQYSHWSKWPSNTRRECNSSLSVGRITALKNYSAKVPRFFLFRENRDNLIRNLSAKARGDFRIGILRAIPLSPLRQGGIKSRHKVRYTRYDLYVIRSPIVSRPWMPVDHAAHLLSVFAVSIGMHRTRMSIGGWSTGGPGCPGARRSDRSEFVSARENEINIRSVFKVWNCATWCDLS